MKEFIKKNLTWTNKPTNFEITDAKIRITPDPDTDLWQRTHYNNSVDSGHILQMTTAEEYFKFSVKVSTNYSDLFDQAGIIVYINSQNWVKASCENLKDHQKLGSVVTNQGYSDWATQEIPASIHDVWYRLTREKSDFIIEASFDGTNYQQLRIFHLFGAEAEIPFGIYAASPWDGPFDAIFTQMHLEKYEKTE